MDVSGDSVIRGYRTDLRVTERDVNKMVEAIHSVREKTTCVLGYEVEGLCRNRTICSIQLRVRRRPDMNAVCHERW